MRSRQYAVFLVIITIRCEITESTCRTISFCDNLDDAFHNEEIVTWNQLIIGHEAAPAKTMKGLSLETLLNNIRATSLTIIGQVSHFVKQQGSCPIVQLMNSINMYKNNIKSISRLTFMDITVRVLSLTDNNIELIEQFCFGAVETIDLSNNLIQEVRRFVFMSGEKWRLQLKQITLKNNKIVFVESNSFPDTLEILDLSDNKLRSLENGVFHDLPNLKELYLNNNLLYNAPELAGLHSLRVVDLSSNRILLLKQKTFNTTSILDFIDLSNNKLIDINVTDLLISKNPPKFVALGYNQLHQITMDLVKKPLSNTYFALFGNPWFCSQWDSQQNFLRKLNIRLHYLDKRMLTNGRNPYCLASDHASVTDTEEFSNIVKQNDRPIRFYYWRSTISTRHCTCSITRNLPNSCF